MTEIRPHGRTIPSSQVEACRSDSFPLCIPRRIGAHIKKCHGEKVTSMPPMKIHVAVSSANEAKMVRFRKHCEIPTES